MLPHSGFTGGPSPFRTLSAVAGRPPGKVHLHADMDEVGVEEAVVVNFALTDVRDNNATIRAVEEHDDLYGIVTLDEFAGDAPDRLREYMSVDGILGLRLGAVCPHDRMWMEFDPSVSWLADLEDHFAMTDPGVSPEESAFARFADLAEYDVGVKVSEIVHRSTEAFPYADVHDHVTWFVETFGRERVIWGSDYPNVSDEATYGESLRWLDHVDTLSEADREWITERSFRNVVDPAG